MGMAVAYNRYKPVAVVDKIFPASPMGLPPYPHPPSPVAHRVSMYVFPPVACYSARRGVRLSAARRGARRKHAHL
jgi:hypothetical protein